MVKQSPDWSASTAIYPCCANDYAEPLETLDGLVENIVFCDLRPPSIKRPTPQKSKMFFFKSDFEVLLEEITNINILYYRRDGCGEGGSCLPVMGELLYKILPKMQSNSLIITDGSNADKELWHRLSNKGTAVFAGWNLTVEKVKDGLTYIKVNNLPL